MRFLRPDGRGWLLALAFLGCLLGDGAASAAVNPQISASRTSCTSPCAVTFHADGTTATGMNDADAFRKLDYYWTFDDPTAGYWQTGGSANTDTPQSKNVDYGPVAGHVFDEPGSYSVVLSVCSEDGSDCGSRSVTIQVADANTVYAGSATVCVGNSRPTAGQDGCPAGARTLASSNFITALEGADGCDVDNRAAKVRCLLRRGDRFDASGTIDMHSAQGVQIGAFGSLSRPRPYVDAGGANLFDDHAGMQDWTVMDIDFRGPGGPRIFYLRTGKTSPKHLLVYRVGCLGWKNCVDGTINGKPKNGSEDSSGIYLVHMDRTLSVSGMSYAVFGGFRNYWLAGSLLGDPNNDCRGGDQNQHFMRYQGLEYGSVAHNVIGYGQGCAEEILKIHNIHSGRSSGNASTRYFMIEDNEMLQVAGDNTPWAVTVGPQSGSSNSSFYPLEFVHTAIMERNWFHTDTFIGTDDGGFAMKLYHLGNTENITIRNNVSDCTASREDVHVSCSMVLINKRHQRAPDPLDNYVYSNTMVVYPPESGSVSLASIDGPSDGTEVWGNLFYPAAGRSSLLSGPTSVNRDNRIASSDPFVNGGGGNDPDAFRLASPDNIAPVPGIRRDFSGALRDRSRFTRGAWDLGTAPEPGLVPAAPVLHPQAP